MSPRSVVSGDDPQPSSVPVQPAQKHEGNEMTTAVVEAPTVQPNSMAPGHPVHGVCKDLKSIDLHSTCDRLKSDRTHMTRGLDLAPTRFSDLAPSIGFGDCRRSYGTQGPPGVTPKCMQIGFSIASKIARRETNTPRECVVVCDIIMIVRSDRAVASLRSNR
ncbi:hypothetical protein EI94DRAFT_1105051 [Lactarius quietus]|nr:hypothetical protein EI94DRAFT_1105051 [Lactarius quietus]